MLFLFTMFSLWSFSMGSVLLFCLVITSFLLWTSLFPPVFLCLCSAVHHSFYSICQVWFFFFGVNFVPSPQISTFCSDLLGLSFFPCDAVWSCYILSFLARFLGSMCKVQPFVAKQTEATLSCVISPHWLIVNGLERVNQHRSNLLRVLEKASLLFLLASYPLLSAVFCFWMGSYLLVFLRFPSIKGLFYFLSSRKFGYLLHHLLVFYKGHFHNP